MNEVCIYKNPLTYEEKKEYRRILIKYEGNKLRDYVWSKLTTREHIRFLHYIVMITDKMEEIIVGEYL